MLTNEQYTAVDNFICLMRKKIGIYVSHPADVYTTRILTELFMETMQEMRDKDFKELAEKWDQVRQDLKEIDSLRSRVYAS